MEFEELLRRRKMVRHYLGRPVPADKLERILQAALRAPSAGNTQGISLVVVEQAERRRQLAQLARESEWVERGFPPWLSTAPVHLIPCLEPALYHQRYQEPDKAAARPSQDWEVPYWFVDGGALMMLVLLAAAQEGLGAGFQGAHNLPGLAQALQLPPGVLPMGLITLGYPHPEGGPGSSARRPKRDHRIHREQW